MDVLFPLTRTLPFTIVPTTGEQSFMRALLERDDVTILPVAPFLDRITR